MMANSFQVHVLASGSKGNAVLVRAGKTSILVDAGISSKRLVAGLAKAGVKPGELTGIFVTHEHKDHVAGLPVFSRRAAVPIFAREKTWLAMDCRRLIERSVCRLLPETELRIGDIQLRPFFVSHDAAEPVGFEFFYRDKKCVLATDLGFVDSNVKQALAGSEVVLVESNHDVQLLRDGNYPRFLKERIRGSRGHLSNADTAALLADIVGSDYTEVFLLHLSQENNRPQLAQETVRDLLQARGVWSRVSLQVASQDVMVSNCEREMDVI